jgi:hypothetical protein
VSFYDFIFCVFAGLGILQVFDFSVNLLTSLMIGWLRRRGGEK